MQIPVFCTPTTIDAYVQLLSNVSRQRVKLGVFKGPERLNIHGQNAVTKTSLFFSKQQSRNRGNLSDWRRRSKNVPGIEKPRFPFLRAPVEFRFFFFLGVSNTIFSSNSTV